MHVVATAGHVDHGKSTLVRLLTGMEPDRWAEERRRGMTIDLGYAWTDLPSGERIAFVDVPGHERFITNMLAGVGPVPAVMLVVAADEGWRAQTEEHVAALAAFGVEHLLLVVTRSDLRDPTAACEEALDHLDRFGLTPLDVVTVSGTTGAGTDALIAALDRLVDALPPPRVDLPARLWVDRVFSIRGAGVVVTGTLQSGRIRTGETLEAVDGTTYVVRALESCKEAREAVSATARVAVNLRGADAHDLRRGDGLLAPGSWIAAASVDVQLSAPLPAGELTLHVGSAAVPVRVRPLWPEPSHQARLALPQVLALRIGDRGLLRRPGSHEPAIGVRVADVNPLPFARRGDAGVRAEALAMTPTPTADDIVDWHGVLARDTLRAMSPESAEDVTKAIATGAWFVSSRQWDSWRAALQQELSDGKADTRGRSRGALVQSLGLPDDVTLDALLNDIDAQLVHGWVRPAGAVDSWSADVEAALTKVEAQLRSEPFRAPEVGELDAAGLDRRARGKAVEAGRLIAISRDVYLLPEAVDLAVERLGALPETFTVSEARQALNSTRRVVVPLLEHLDGAGYTRRVDATRRRLVRRGRV